MQSQVLGLRGNRLRVLQPEKGVGEQGEKKCVTGDRICEHRGPETQVHEKD